MPFGIRGHKHGLFPQFIRTAFTKKTLSGSICLAYLFDGMIFGYSNKTHMLWKTANDSIDILLNHVLCSVKQLLSYNCKCMHNQELYQDITLKKFARRATFPCFSHLNREGMLNIQLFFQKK